LAVVIIVGGPPNSGKSTFSESLVRALQNQGVSAEAIDLDPWSPTLRFIKGEISKEERDSLKQSKISEKDIQDAVARLKRAGKNHDFVIGDSPGGISDDIRPIYRLATHAMILCREDKRTEIDKWKVFFSTMNLLIVATIITRTSGLEQMRGGDLIEGTLVGLDRTPIDTPAIRSLASILRGKFGL
jgi:MinD-like ATPase involved in chromosome partitioning or flagellar assembly